MEIVTQALYGIMVAAVALVITAATYYFGRALKDSSYLRVWRIQYLIPMILGLAIVCEIIDLAILRVRALLVLASLLVFLYVSYRTVHFMQDYIRVQQETILGLSTPSIQISEGVLVMPLIGMLDSTRARHVTETLLQNVTETKAKAVIMDVTGISTIDTQTANHFVRMIRALRLMGTELIVTGIRPDVSITMAQQGISFGDIIALRNVQQALEHLRRSIENPERESRLTRQ